MSTLEGQEKFDYYRDVVEHAIASGLRDDWNEHAEPVNSVAEIKERLSGMSFPGIRKLTLFGSFAKGRNFDWSDVDLLIDCEKGFDIDKFTIEIEKILGRICDVVKLSSCKSWIRDCIMNSQQEVVYADA